MSVLARYWRRRSIAQIMVVIFVAAISVLGVTLYAVSTILIQALAVEQATKEARLASAYIFQALYSSMRVGWVESEIQAILDQAGQDLLPGSHIALVRSASVAALFGDNAKASEQRQASPDIAQVLSSGQELARNDGRTIKLIHPFVVQPACLRCHTNVDVGHVNGVAEITIPLATLSRPMRATLGRTLYALVAVAVVILLMAFYLARRLLVRPLMQLSDHMTDLRHSERLCKRTRLVETSQDFLELRHLAQSFDALMDDLTDSQEQLREQAEQLRFVLEGSELGFWDWNILTGEVERNAHWAAMLGYTQAEIADTVKQWTDFIHPDDRERAWQSVQAVLDGRASVHRLEYRMLHKDGSARWILDQAKVMQRDRAGSPTRMSGTHTDITERKRLEQALERQAHFDFLTQVCTRGYFLEQAQREIAIEKRYGLPFSLLMLDIDHFKAINDRFGHPVGDKVLKRLAEICLRTFREMDVVGRLGGEEFAILLPSTTKTAALLAAERLRATVARSPVPVANDLSVSFTISVGVATTFDEAYEGIDELLTWADMALYAAKHAGRNRVCQAPARAGSGHADVGAS